MPDKNMNNLLQLNSAINNKNIADKYRKKEKFDRAIDYYKKAITLDPDYLNAWLCLGIAYRQKKEYDKAIECY